MKLIFKIISDDMVRESHKSIVKDFRYKANWTES